MGLYVDGYNSFRVFSTPNQFAMNFLNPFHPLVTMKVTIDFPLLPNIEETNKKWKEVPPFTLVDFLGYCQPFERLLEDENSFLYNAFLLYRALAINNIQYGNVKDEINWKFLISMYIGHYLELHLEDLKDSENKYSLENTSVEKKYTVQDLAILEKNEFMKTSYGIRFWEKYKIIGAFVFKGHRKQRGRY